MITSGLIIVTEVENFQKRVVSGMSTGLLKDEQACYRRGHPSESTSGVTLAHELM